MNLKAKIIKKMVATLVMIIIVTKVSAQVQFSGTLNYKTTPANSWEGIDADFQVGINGSTSPGGVSFDYTVYNIKINSLKIRNKEISPSQIPANVLAKLINGMRVSNIDFGLYVNSAFLKKMETRTNIGWAQLQRLDNAEGYKQSVRESGYKLFNNGALSIKNPVIKSVIYIVDAAYRTAIENEITGGGKKSTTQHRTANDKVTELKLTMSSSGTSGSSSTSKGSSSSGSSSSAAEESEDSNQAESSNVTIHNNIFAAEAYKKQQQQQLIADGAKLMGDFFDNWQANREKRWAKENLEYERHKEKVELDRAAYYSFINSQNNTLFKNLGSYQAMLKTMLPKVLASKSMTWEDIIGSPDYNSVFGKDLKSVSRKLKIIQPKEKNKSNPENVPTDDLPKNFTHKDLSYAYSNQTIFYWVNNDFYEHITRYIFDNNNVLVGMSIDLHTAAREDKAFPSSLHEYISLKSYYDGLIKNMHGNYFFADGKTMVTRDKIFILDFKSLVIYDLNYFDPNTLFDLPAGFKQSLEKDINKLGINVLGIREDDTKKITKVRINEVDKNSIAEKMGLLPGDMILNVNDRRIDFPFHLQWYFLAFPDEKNITLQVERAKKIEQISIKLK